MLEGLVNQISSREASIALDTGLGTEESLTEECIARVRTNKSTQKVEATVKAQISHQVLMPGVSLCFSK